MIGSHFQSRRSGGTHVDDPLPMHFQLQSVRRDAALHVFCAGACRCAQRLMLIDFIRLCSRCTSWHGPLHYVTHTVRHCNEELDLTLILSPLVAVCLSTPVPWVGLRAHHILKLLLLWWQKKKVTCMFYRPSQRRVRGYARESRP